MPQEPQTPQESQPSSQPDEIPPAEARLLQLADRIEQLSRDTVNAIDILDEQLANLHRRELQALKRIEEMQETTLSELRLFVRDQD